MIPVFFYPLFHPVGAPDIERFSFFEENINSLFRNLLDITSIVKFGIVELVHVSRQLIENLLKSCIHKNSPRPLKVNRKPNIINSTE